MKAVRLLFLLAPLAASGQSTIDPDGDSFAYGANTGWVDFRPSAADGITVTGAYLTGYAYAANFGWIRFGGGPPANGHTYSNASAADCGVNHDGAGNLTGYAYAANIGWINFGWTHSDDPQRPRIDLLTGDFAGHAYSANTGWINLGAGHLRTATLAFPDSDGDGIADAWEMQWFGNLTAANARTDDDGDGESDVAEFITGTKPVDHASKLRIISHDYNAAMTQVTLLFGHTTAARLYRIEHSTDLLPPWSPFPPGLFAADAGGFTTRTVYFPPGPRRFFRFFRISAVLPLQP